MKWISVLGMALLTGIGASAPAAEPAPVLTLPQAIHQALAQNPQQISQRLEVDKAGAQQQAAHGAQWPTLEFNAAATRYGYPTFVYSIRELGTFPPLDDTIYDYGVALRLPLYAGGRLTQGVTLADLGKQIALERERLGTQELTYNVSAVYLKVQHLMALEQAYAARILSLEAQAKRVTLLRQVGRAPKLDLLRIQGLLTKARHDRLQIENRRREAWTLLYQLMGEERPAQEMPLTHYVAAPVPLSGLEQLRQEAGAQRPEIKIAEQQSAAGAAQEEMARAERRPAVSLVSGYRERSGSDWQFYDDWNVGVQLSVPLLDGGVRRARVDQAALARQQAHQAMQQTRLEVAKQVQDVWDAQAEAVSRLQVTATSVAEANEALSIEKLKYEQGVGVTTDLLNAESALLTAEADRLQAQFDLIITRFNILRASGALNPERAATLVVPYTGSAEEGSRP
jgi:outer membrane protein TolC